MKYSVHARTIAVAAITSLLAVGVASAGSAEEGELPTLGLTTASVLTLPDADGVRDTTSVTVSSTLPTDVTAALVPTAGGDPVKVFAPVTLAEGTLSATIDIPVTGLAAGNYDLVATPTTGASVTTPVTVGSGEPATVSLALSAAKIYTWSKATPRSTTATVSAVDETGLAVPFSGTVTAKVGTKTASAAIASTTGAAATATFAVSKFVAGSGTVAATVHGASLVDYSSNVASLKVLSTAVSSVKVARSLATVYPAKDSYRDTVKFTVTPTTTTGTSFASTGTVKITRKGKTVKSWKLTSSAAKSFTWDGKVGGKIVPGTYTVSVSLKGPEGATKTVKSTIKVDSGKLKTKTKTVSHYPSKVFTTYLDYSASGLGECGYGWSATYDIYCEGYSAYYDDTFSIFSLGSVAIPSEVKSAQKYGSTTAAVALTVPYAYGSGAWGYGDSTSEISKAGSLKLGTTGLGKFTLAKGASRVYISFGLGEYTDMNITKVKVTYTYKVMTH
ncbi:hypothetical protein [Demequina sp.]|uniref:hypothetical protein n=1 Tax=Demequina sp. TaxID=2050685 RepID=UPI003D0FE279